METPSRDQILLEIQRMMKDLFELDAERVQPDSRLIEDLELDSLDAIDLAVKVEESTGLAFEEKQIRGLRTIDDVITALESMIKEKGINPRPAASAPAPADS